MYKHLMPTVDLTQYMLDMGKDIFITMLPLGKGYGLGMCFFSLNLIQKFKFKSKICNQKFKKLI